MVLTKRCRSLSAESRQFMPNAIQSINHSFPLADYSCPAGERIPAETAQRMNFHFFDFPVGSPRTKKIKALTCVKAEFGRTGFAEPINSPPLQSKPSRSTLMTVDGAV